jgi:CxxC motif-containing protein
MKRELTCIVCPIGCQLSVTLENGVVTEVTGNTCPRGKQYATDECTNPVRTITTTARTADGGVIPVKTAQPIPKELMFDCMQEINKATVTLPAHIGDVVIKNLLNTGVDVVVTANMK